MYAYKLLALFGPVAGTVSFLVNKAFPGVHAHARVLTEWSRCKRMSASVTAKGGILGCSWVCLCACLPVTSAVGAFLQANQYV